MIIKGLNFIKTCSAYPEQYDVQDECGNQVGYVRLRWGELKCDYPDVGGEVIYSACFNDNLIGCFENDEQRKYYLDIVADKILKKTKNNLFQGYSVEEDI